MVSQPSVPWRRWVIGSLAALGAVSAVLLLGTASGWRMIAWRTAGTTAPAEEITVDKRPVLPRPSAAREGPESSSRAASPSSPATALAPVVRVSMRATRRVWLRVDVDGRTAVSRLLRSGEELDFTGRRDVVLRAGDAGAVLLEVDGRPPARLGPDGAVVTRRLTARQPLTIAPDARSPASSGREASVATALEPTARTQPGHSTSELERAVAVEPPPAASPAATTTPFAIAPEAPSQAPAAATPAPNDEEAAVLQGHEAYIAALRTGDTGGIARLATDGFSSSGIEDDGGSGPVDIAVGDVRLEIRGIGAVVTGTATRTMRTPDGRRSGQQPLMFSEVWIKRDGEWKLIDVRFASAANPR